MAWMLDPDNYLTIKQAATLLGWDERLVRAYMYKGWIRKAKLGKKITYLHKLSVLRLIESIEKTNDKH